MRDAVNVAINYFKANAHRVSASIHPEGSDVLLSVVDLQGTGGPDQAALALLIALCSGFLGRPIQSQLVSCVVLFLGLLPKLRYAGRQPINNLHSVGFENFA